MTRCSEARQRGAELVEFALVLPAILLLLVGIVDFGAAFALRQKMTNAARECARIVVSEPLSDQSCQSATPCAIVAGANAAVAYMGNAGASLACIQPAAPTSSSALEWTYACAGGATLVINRGYTISGPGGGLIPATQVTLTYPVAWCLGGLAPSAPIATQVTMPDLVS